MVNNLFYNSSPLFLEIIFLMYYPLHPQPQFVNNSRNTIIKNRIVLSPFPHPQPHLVLNKPPNGLLLPHPQPQFLSSGIILPP